PFENAKEGAFRRRCAPRRNDVAQTQPCEGFPGYAWGAGAGVSDGSHRFRDSGHIDTALQSIDELRAEWFAKSEDIKKINTPEGRLNGGEHGRRHVSMR
ncbi:MAG: hypothetical protein QGD94_12125, partial [Planctomycetia bacterium]|nr:hypothetical protein [Planctomycetia bacterium]